VGQQGHTLDQNTRRVCILYIVLCSTAVLTVNNVTFFLTKAHVMPPVALC
jgi:hypothetical protein